MESTYDRPQSEVRLETQGATIVAGNGTKVGTALRNIAFIFGCSKETARKIHREHVKFHSSGDDVELEVLGENPTRLNGQLLSKGDRVTVSDGDTLELSGVIETPVTIN